jgi:hypothetical protein
MTGNAPDSTSVAKRENSVFPAAVRSGQSLIHAAISSTAIGFADSLITGRCNPDGVFREVDLDPALSMTCCIRSSRSISAFRSMTSSFWA